MMFSSAVMFWNRLKCWNTIPIEARCCEALLSEISISPFGVRRYPRIVPDNSILPRLIGSIRLMHRSRVDLPEPEAPMMQTTSPRSTLRSTPRRTSCLPKALWTLNN
jgi:hypothetical protein